MFGLCYENDFSVFLRNEAASNLNMKSSYFRTAKKNYTGIP